MVRKKVLIRLDDICPTMNWALWESTDEFLKVNKVKPLLGVIPDCVDSDLYIMEAKSDFWEWLKKKQAEGYVIAMHGLNHVFSSMNRGILTTRIGSEFAGVPYEEQLAKLQEGKRILNEHGIYTDIFFAPGHSYDDNTVKALKKTGFKYVSDGKSSKAYKWHGITFLPCRNSGAGFRKHELYSTSIYHIHEWTDPNKNAFGELKKIIESRSYSIVNFEEYLKQPIGNLFLQRIIEKCYVFLQFNIAPILRKIRS